MAVINITITESVEQIVDGIPKSVTITTNIPSSIFYTLDGSTPTLFSNVYTGTLFIPYDQLRVDLNVFASNGVTTSSVVANSYTANMLDNTRLPQSATTADPKANQPGLYPFGTPQYQSDALYLNPGDAGVTVNDPALAQNVVGYDLNGVPNSFTNKPYTTENYNIVYTTKDSSGAPIVGNLPAAVTIQAPQPIPDESEQFTSLFDPRALVIFQDFSKEDPNGPIMVNKQFFTLEDPETARHGNAFFTSGLNAPPVNGTFLRSHYNPRDNTMTYYYLDTWANRWIISKTPYQQGSFDGNLSTAFVDRGSDKVFNWLPFQRRHLL